MTDDAHQRIDELERENEALRARLDAYERQLGELKRIVLGDYEIGEPAVEEADGLFARVSSVEQGDIKPSDEMTADVRSELLPLHKAWIDTRQGNGDHVQSKSLRRAARLFARFLWRETDRDTDDVVPINAGPHNYEMDSDTAEAILERDDDLDVADSSRGQTVLRAMRMAAGGSKDYDCDCESAEGCTHGLVRYVVEGEAKLQVPKEPLRDYLERVEAVVNSDVTTGGEAGSADDAGSEPVEATDTAEAIAADADERLEQLAQTDGGPR